MRKYISDIKYRYFKEFLSSYFNYITRYGPSS